MNQLAHVPVCLEVRKAREADLHTDPGLSARKRVIIHMNFAMDKSVRASAAVGHVRLTDETGDLIVIAIRTTRWSLLKC